MAKVKKVEIRIKRRRSNRMRSTRSQRKKGQKERMTRRIWERQEGGGGM